LLPPRRHPSDIQDARLIAVLVKYVPPIIARSIVERARREAASGPEVSWTDPNGLLDRISVGVRLFADPEHQSAILRAITDLAAADREASPSSRPFTDDAGPASALKPSSHRGRAIEDAATTRREATPPPSGGSSGGPSSAGAAGLPLPPPAGPPPSGGSPPSSASGHQREPVSGGPLSRRDTDIMGVFSVPTRRTPIESPPPSRGVFPTTPRVASPTGRTIRSFPAVTPPPGAHPTTPSPASSPTPAPAKTPVPPATPTPAIPPPPPSSRPNVTPLAGVPRHSAPLSERVESREITITLTTEHDIPRARQVAREICEALGTRALTQQRLVTIVSELGRNMVLYAGGGKITLRPPISSTRRVVVLAVDQGPGIANLSDIMNGRYKSRSGLGLGIVGTKRLADSFHIETSRSGTAISVEVIV
jgi:anti-sigma regulatory factor (Ser/Thr protein kinase)